MKSIQVGNLLLCLYILHSQGYEAKYSRRHHGRSHHGKYRNVVAQQDYPTADKNYLAVAKLSGYITKNTKTQKKAASSIIKNFKALPTEDKLEYSFFPISSGVVQFKVRSANDALIELSCSAEERDPMYQVFIGGWSNARSVIRKNRTESDVAKAETPGVLNGNEFRDFWVRWNNGTISAGNEAKSTPFLSYTDSESLMIEYVAVRTGSGASGSWNIGVPDVRGCPQGTVGMCWVAADSGTVPSGAYIGGEENGEPMYIIRAKCKDGLVPGKLLSSRGASFVPWGGDEFTCSSYEVLCDFDGNWQQCSGNAIPSNAIVAGTGEGGDDLYVGRVKHEGSLIVGKVQSKYSACFIPYGGRELKFTDYEIMVL